LNLKKCLKDIHILCYWFFCILKTLCIYPELWTGIREWPVCVYEHIHWGGKAARGQTLQEDGQWGLPSPTQNQKGGKLSVEIVSTKSLTI